MLFKNVKNILLEVENINKPMYMKTFGGQRFFITKLNNEDKYFLYECDKCWKPIDRNPIIKSLNDILKDYNNIIDLEISY
jgi:hypothetical protein